MDWEGGTVRRGRVSQGRHRVANRRFPLYIPLVTAVVLFAAVIQGASAAPTLIVDNNVNSPGYGYYIPDYFTTPNWANSPPLRKFVDNVAGLGPAGANNLGQYISVAVPDNTTYPGSDYYEIAVVQYREQLHSDLPPVVGAKTSPAATGGTKLRGYVQEVNGVPLDQPHYLGPVIVAQRNRPVRIKFTNRLPAGAGGDLFVPVDTTIMGSGPFEIDYDPVTKAPIAPVTGMFAQNRATLHLHGGRTPWISDGTPHQWVTPAGETTVYPKGVSVQYVPDMWFDSVTGATIASCAGQTTCGVANATNNPGTGSATFYWTNQQSGRLMFYHDHAWGITRLNVYIGEAAGYMIQDNVELAMVNGGTVNGRTFTAGTIPADQIPLVIQDKTFVDNSTVMTTDPTWAWGSQPGQPVGTPVTGDLWWPHVYMTAQNPYNPNMTGMNDFGRWHYGPWFFPPTPVCGSSPQAVKPNCIDFGPVANPYFGQPGQPPAMPGTPNPSWGAEAFLDTMMVNGTMYPSLTVAPKSYRFRILNAAHDRFLNLQLYKAAAIVDNIVLGSGGSGYTADPAVTISGVGTGATATATVDLTLGSPTFGQVIAVNLATVGSGYTAVPTVTIAPPGGAGTTATATATIHTAPTEVGMVPATLTAGFPANWPTDGREGGVPDPATSGPQFIQIGSEGGFLPQPVVLPTQPVVWNVDPTMFNVGNVLQQNQGGGTLFLGPAERADVIVDFSAYAGQTLILYNDAPTAFPALVPQYDYYTGAPDRSAVGGYGPIPAGVGPNIRTVMQIVVENVAAAPAFNLANLQAAFLPSGGVGGTFIQGQDPVVVGQTAYNSTYSATFPATWPNWGISRISDLALSFQGTDNVLVSNFVMKRKAIHDEMGATFDGYGRMSAKLGLEVDFANNMNQTFAMQNYIDPPTEFLSDNQVQIWRITHNGVDTHPIHFHLFDVQVVNRVGWDGFIRLPDSNELGWKDTVRISPLEDTIVALRPHIPKVPFALPQSVRPLNPQAPIGSMMDFSQTDPLNAGPMTPPTVNEMFNFGYEYVWHCHILSHEENDMMRSVVVAVRPQADFLGLGSTNIAVFRPGTGQWWVRTLASAVPVVTALGTAGNKLVPGDYDGDRKSDAAVWDTATGNWTILNSGTGTQSVFNYGTTGDIPVLGDFDGDGKSDFAVWRPGNFNWYIYNSAGGPQTVFNYGTTGDIPVPGDYDGDGKTDIAVWRPSNGNWYIYNSAGGPQTVFGYGTTGDIPVPGDYDGDRKSDFAVWRNGTWYIYNSATGTQTVVSYGAAGDIPVPGDYQNLGRTEIAVWRPSNGNWYIRNPMTGAQSVVTFGDPTDQPVKTGQPVQ